MNGIFGQSILTLSASGAQSRPPVKQQRTIATTITFPLIETILYLWKIRTGSILNKLWTDNNSLRLNSIYTFSACPAIQIACRLQIVDFAWDRLIFNTFWIYNLFQFSPQRKQRYSFLNLHICLQLKLSSYLNFAYVHWAKNAMFWNEPQY